MTPELVLNNVLAWMAQVFVLASAGALLPLAFRLQHPRSQLAYCHFVLVACLVLPLLQPWTHPIVFIGGTTPASSIVAPVVAGSIESAATSISWEQLLIGLLAAGVVVRLCWLGIGLYNIRRYRLTATPLYPIPESVTTAGAITGTRALFCISRTAGGPVTFGLLRPVVLLPESFLTLSGDAQRAIACHELFHVQRHDWLITMMEEVVGALFWFHPGFWWLRAQTRLVREQLVDADVVRVTAAREPYIHALLAIAGARTNPELAPAPLFLHKRHLTQRMHSLLTEVSMSKTRLFSSYAVMAAILAVAAWTTVTSFPLIGEATTVQQQPGFVVQRTPLFYPRTAAGNGIEGTVVVELAFNGSGEIVDSRVLSGPEQLRQAGLQTALQGNYGINGARTLQVIVDFKQPVPPPPPPPPPAPGGVVGGINGTDSNTLNAPPPPPLPPPPPGGVVGGIIGTDGNTLNAPPPPPPPPPPAPSLGILEDIQVIGVAEPILSRLHVQVDGFRGKPMSSDVLRQIRNGARTAGLDQPLISSRRNASSNTVVEIFGSREVMPAGPGVLEAVQIDGLPEPLNSELTGRLQTFRGRPMSMALVDDARRVSSELLANTNFKLANYGAHESSSGNSVMRWSYRDLTGLPQYAAVSSSRLGTVLQSVDPVYPPLAIQARIQGVVVAQVTITPQGTVSKPTIVAGHPLFRQPVLDAISKWVYQPASAGQTDAITINFMFR